MQLHWQADYFNLLLNIYYTIWCPVDLQMGVFVISRPRLGLYQPSPSHTFFRPFCKPNWTIILNGIWWWIWVSLALISYSSIPFLSLNIHKISQVFFLRKRTCDRSVAFAFMFRRNLLPFFIWGCYILLRFCPGGLLSINFH